VFRLTARAYSEKTNLEAVVAGELGPASVLADWSEVRHLIAARRTTGKAFCETIGLAKP